MRRHFQRLALAAEGHCVQLGRQHCAAYQVGVFSHFELPADSIEPTAFLRALFAMELGGFSLVGRLAATTRQPTGPGTTAGGDGQTR
ncbi:DUF6420 family protein [Streptomyces sp. NPDC056160]|uniref:DUF6420 family protein n=1 Tax=Streptomyces sp. NPDC056160 TaxID=3345731 RepID=UPI0035DC904D